MDASASGAEGLKCQGSKTALAPALSPLLPPPLEPLPFLDLETSSNACTHVIDPFRASDPRKNRKDLELQDLVIEPMLEAGFSQTRGYLRYNFDL